MLPDYIKAKDKMLNLIKLQIDQKVKESTSPMIGRERIIFEGEGISTKMEDGAELSTPLQRLSGKFTIKFEDIKTGNTGAITESIQKIANDIALEKNRIIHDTLMRTCEDFNQKVDYKLKPFEPEMLLECIEKLVVDFDENGKMEGLSIVLSPNIRDGFIKKMDKALKDPDFKIKHDELIEKKRLEYRDREASSVAFLI